jgi:hypothetical protein
MQRYVAAMVCGISRANPEAIVLSVDDMSWKPIAEIELWDLINAAESRMTPPQSRLWDAIRISPEKWQQQPYGTEGGGFWVVGILGTLVVWCNDIEDGFNCSKYSAFGLIEDYWCNQDLLECTIQALLGHIVSGHALYAFAPAATA